MSGHGPDEAALGVALRIAWRALVLAGLSTEAVLRGVEQVLLVERNDEERYATVSMISFNAALTQADVVLCGHPAPLLIRGDEVREVPAEALPILTMLDQRPIEPVRVDLDGDWGLLSYTDGLVEGCNAPGETARFGAAELTRVAETLLRKKPARSELAPALLAEAERRHGGPLPDDVAVLLIGTLAWW